MAYVLVVCVKRYNGHELWPLLGRLHDRGHDFEVVSTDHVIEDDDTQVPNQVRFTLGQITVEEAQEQFDGIVVVSGNPQDTDALCDNMQLDKLVRAFDAQSKCVAAICAAVPAIRSVCKGKRVSFFPLIKSRDLLRQAGAILTKVSLTVDQNLVTAEHQMAARMWGDEICNLLEGKPPQYQFTDSGYVPKGRPRYAPKEVQKLLPDGHPSKKHE